MKADAAQEAFAPQLLTHIGLDEVQRYVEDDEWVAEQKFDGVRCVVRARGGRVEFLTRGGRPLVHSASALHFDRLRSELAPVAAQADFTLDGELIPREGVYVVFDLVELPGDEVFSVSPATPFRLRRFILEGVFESWATMAPHPSVVLAAQASGSVEKAEFLLAIHDQVGEGAVFKRLDAPYDSTGGRVEHSVKAKFEATYDLVVVDRNRGTSVSVNGERGQTLNAVLAYWDQERGDLVECGSCSMIGKPDAKVGDVVEVKVLYVTESLTVYQPTLLRVRDDKVPAECTADQFRVVSRKLVQVPR